jgi:hypothetical protein
LPKALPTFALSLLLALLPQALCSQNPSWPWRTDTSRRTTPLADFALMLEPDGIPSIDRPRFARGPQASEGLADDEPVIELVLNGEARAYPLSILIWHEVVNDQVGGVPVCIAFCPLCHSAVVYRRLLNTRSGQRYLLDFGTSGMLRHTDLVMYDRQTHTWWQQFTGEGLVGRLAGEQLERVPSQLSDLKGFLERWPQGGVLRAPLPGQRDYGSSPYTGYDSDPEAPGYFGARPDSRLPPTERVLDACLGGRCRIYPFSALEAKGLLQDTLAGRRLVLFFRPGVLSVMDGPRIAESRAAGTAAVFRAAAGGRELDCERAAGGFRDLQTGSLWDAGGRAVSGELQGQQLELIPHQNSFAFAWLRFYPQSSLYKP